MFVLGSRIKSLCCPSWLACFWCSIKLILTPISVQLPNAKVNRYSQSVMYCTQLSALEHFTVMCLSSLLQSYAPSKAMCTRLVTSGTLTLHPSFFLTATYVPSHAMCLDMTNEFETWFWTLCWLLACSVLTFLSIEKSIRGALMAYS